MLLWATFDQNSIIVRLKLRDTTTGNGKTGLSSSSSGLIISTIADSEATPTVYTQAGSTIETITTLGTYAAPTATKCRFKEVDATNHKGIYELQFADARFSISGAKSILISISGVSGMVECDAVIPLPTVDLFATNGQIASNLKAIDEQATSGNNATLKLKQLDITNSAGTAVIAKSTGSNGHGINAEGNGSGSGTFTKGGATGHGHYALGGATSGNGILTQSQSGATSGDAFHAQSYSDDGDAISGQADHGNGIFGRSLGPLGSDPDAHGMYLKGYGTGNGLRAEGGATGDGAIIGAVSGNGNGLTVNGSGSGGGLKMNGGATGPGFAAQGGASGAGGEIIAGASGGVGLDIESQAAGESSIYVFGDPDILLDGSKTLEGDLDGRVIGDVILGTVSDAGPAVGDFDGVSTLSSSNDFYNGAVLVFTSGTLKGIARKISDYVGSSRNLQFTGSTGAADSPFPTAPANGDKFEILGRIG